MPEEQLFILCNSDNEPALAVAENAWHHMTPERISNSEYNIEKVLFISFTLNHELDDILEYRFRKDEYQKGILQDTTDIVESIGTIFAHPEWFPDDENVRKAFPRIYPKE